MPLLQIQLLLKPLMRSGADHIANKFKPIVDPQKLRFARDAIKNPEEPMALCTTSISPSGNGNFVGRMSVFY